MPRPPAAVVFLAAIHVALALSASVDRSATADETDYLGAGRWLVETGNWAFSSAGFHPPLAYYLNSLFLPEVPARVWEATPPEGSRFVSYDRQVGEEILYRSGLDPGAVLFRARLPIAIASGLLVLLVWAWACEWLGERPARLAAVLAAFCPNLLAHAGVVATDSVLATTYFAGAYALWRFGRRPTLGRLAVLGAAVALAALSKVPGAFLVPAAAAVFLWRRARAAFRSPGSRWLEIGRCRRAAGELATSTLVAGAVGGAVFWAGYLFSVGRILDPENRPHRGVDARVPETLGLRRAAYAVLEAPLPAPAYAGVIRTLAGHSQAGHHAYLAGERNLHGWWYYFPVALAVKTPLPTLLLAAAGIVLLAWGRGIPTGRAELVAAALLAFLPSLASPIAIGVRHVLHLYPFLFLAASATVAGERGTKLPWRILAGISMVWLVAGTALDYPHFIPSFHAGAGGPRGGHRILSDSNVDWGQDLENLELAREHLGAGRMSLDTLFFVPPDTGPRTVPRQEADVLALGVTTRHGQYDRSDLDRYSGYDPDRAVLRVGHSIEIYDVGRARSSGTRP